MEAKVRRGIGLVAHDAMKKDLIEWVLWNSELLMGNKFYCTGTTGTLILEALKEKHPDEEWDFTILKSGPLGGDQQMGSRIVDGQIDYLFFFTDPMTLRSEKSPPSSDHTGRDHRSDGRNGLQP